MCIRDSRGAIASVRRLGQTRFAPNEILVIFKDPATRDSVIGSSGQLAGMVDQSKNNSPTAGIRAVVPSHLRGTEKQLLDYGRRLRGKHGKGTKTHVKFDDGDRSIYLNVKLKDENSWSRVYPEFAVDWLKKLKRTDALELNKKLNCDIDSERQGRQDGARKSPGASAAKPRSTTWNGHCLLYTSPSPRDLSTSRMPSSA